MGSRRGEGRRWKKGARGFLRTVNRAPPPAACPGASSGTRRTRRRAPAPRRPAARPGAPRRARRARRRGSGPARPASARPPSPGAKPASRRRRGGSPSRTSRPAPWPACTTGSCPWWPREPLADHRSTKESEPIRMKKPAAG